jgi:teichuronic acid biosynthesis glycosyltransferase TuaG
VTVLTAVRNGARHFSETIESVRNQTFTDWEYVIVDDASEDETPQIVERAMTDDPRIRLIRRTERGGPYAAANEGLRYALGRYIVRLDADDLALPQRIERQLVFLERTGLRACASLWLRRLPDGELAEGISQADWGVRSLKWRLCVRPQMVHSTACIERNALEEIGGYRELPVSQDLRMWCDLARKHWLGVVPEVLGQFRRPGGLTSSSAELQEDLALEILREHLEALSIEPWSKEEVRALRPAWTGIPVGLRIAALRRWSRHWRADTGLSREERRELARLGRGIRWHVTRQALRREGLSFATLRGTLSVGRKPIRTSVH